MPLSRQRTIHFASFLGENAFSFYRQVVDSLRESTGIACALVRPFSPDASACLTHHIQAAFLCGIRYVWLTEAGHDLALLGAPVMTAERYGGQSVYFADFIVPAASALTDLQGARDLRVGYNEAESFSGYVLPRHTLSTLGLAPEALGRWIQTGSHAASMDAIAAGALDLAAIDSVVLDMELRQRPERAGAWRVLASSPPAPMPPVVVRADVDADVIASLADGLTRLHTTEAGAALLAQAGMLRFAPRVDSDYDPVRRILADPPPIGARSTAHS
jgi:ABC-type phosphate/phosphonate transport system substrate-binding protein